MTQQMDTLLQKLSAARSVAEELMISAAASGEINEWRVPYYQKLIDGIDRRAAAFKAQGLHFPKASSPVSVGLYQGVSEWCDDDDLIEAVADVEDYYLGLQTT